MYIFEAKNIITFAEFDKFTNYARLKYKNKKEEVLKKYNIYDSRDWDKDINSYQSFRKDYRECALMSFKEVINYYKKYLPKEHIVLLEGSFARNSDRLFSDIDYTLIYDEERTEYLIAVEELINLSLSIIFEFSIDRVHSIFFHITNTTKDYEDELISEENNNFKMIFKDGEIEYKCRENTFQDVIMNLFSVRNYKSFILYIENQMKINSLYEWLYSFKIIDNTTNYNILEDIKNLEKLNNKIYINYIKEGYTLPQNVFTVAHLKKVIKYDCLDNFYLFISQIRKFYQAETGDYDFLDIEKFLFSDVVSRLLGNETLNDLKNLFIEYLVLLNRIEISLNRRGIILSSHSFFKITKSELEKYYYTDWGHRGVLKDIIMLKQSLFKHINYSLKTLESNNIIELCTFPCSPRYNNSIEKCLLYLVVNYLGKIISNSYTTANINALGMNKKIELLDAYRDFLNNKLKLDFNSEKIDLNYKEFALKNIKELVQRKIITIESKEIINCACGIVEMVVNDDNQFYLNPDLFTVKKVGDKDVCICNKCGQECAIETNEALFLKFNYFLEDMKNIDIYPEFSKKQFCEIAEKRINNDLMISRKRETGIQLEVENKVFNIDIDFVWQFLILDTKKEQTIAVTGYREIFCVFLSAFINNLCFKKNIKYITLPIVQSNQSFPYELSREVENMAYFLSTKINKQNTQITNSVKTALCKKQVFNKIKRIVFDSVYYKVNDNNMFFELCNVVKKRQQLL